VAVEAERDAAIGPVGADAGQQVHAAETDRDHALARAAQANQAAQLAQPEVSRAHAAERAVREETAWIYAHAEKTLAGFRADAARDRDEIRADLRARAERAERQADAYREELAQLRVSTTEDEADAPAGSRSRRPRP
jgi:hypothetical protein